MFKGKNEDIKKLSIGLVLVSFFVQFEHIQNVDVLFSINVNPYKTSATIY